MVVRRRHRRVATNAADHDLSEDPNMACGAFPSICE
jgi:hypothetical protein